MNMKNLVAAAMLAATASTSFAATINEDDITADQGFGFSIDKPFSGIFSNTYEFTLSGEGELSDTVTNSFTSKSGYITDFAVSLSGPGVSYDQDVGSFAGGQGVFVDYAQIGAGTYFLTVSGTAHSSTYGGSVSVSAVPEPASIALMLTGLGCIGFVAKRRKQG
jgi:hypothetical protein